MECWVFVNLSKSQTANDQSSDLKQEQVYILD